MGRAASSLGVPPGGPTHRLCPEAQSTPTRLPGCTNRTERGRKTLPSSNRYSHNNRTCQLEHWHPGCHDDVDPAPSRYAPDDPRLAPVLRIRTQRSRPRHPAWVTSPSTTSAGQGGPFGTSNEYPKRIRYRVKINELVSDTTGKFHFQSGLAPIFFHQYCSPIRPMDPALSLDRRL